MNVAICSRILSCKQAGDRRSINRRGQEEDGGLRSMETGVNGACCPQIPDKKENPLKKNAGPCNAMYCNPFF